MKLRRASNEDNDMNEGAFLYFRISGNDLDFNEINRLTNKIPCNTYAKGDVIKNNFFETVITEDCWMSEYQIHKDQSLNEAILSFLRPYVMNESYIVSLSNENKVALYLSVYPENYHYCVHLSKETIAMLYRLNLELEITLTNLSEFYDGKK